jgi:hypothetical protein
MRTYKAKPLHIDCKKSSKFVLVLSHRYTPDGLQGLNSLNLKVSHK